ncbi:hypothetical protein SDC9_74601 [bioreactor metagenome]|uniref:Glycosyl transferase family 1 domain-containing protein n=1 Tax=bioreactor metagenome TaxID=1076179 RepID=A0A644YPQ7_9ZZZZ
MKRIFIITMATNLPDEKGYNRFKYLSEILSEDNFEVTLITSKFNHYDKLQRDNTKYDEKYNIVLLDSCAYKENISFKRIISIIQFGNNVKKYLKNHKDKVDILYCAVPALYVCNLAGKYSEKFNKEFIIDIQDLWPEAMELLIKNKKISNILFYPIKKFADKSYRRADKIIAVSKEYLERALCVNKKSKKNEAVYIGTFLEEFDLGAQKFCSDIEKNKKEFWITYIGTLGLSYDIKTLIEAYQIIIKQGYTDIKIKILGRGPDEKELKAYSKSLGLCIDFIGYMEYGKMAAFLKKSDVGINAIKRNAAQSIINKVGDYFSAGLLVLNGSNCQEMKNLILKYNTGINYEAENANDLSEKILEAYNLSNDKKAEISKNSRILAEEKFNRSTTYKNIIELINA